MSAITKIVTPVDFSSPSVAAANYARDLAVSLGAQLVLLHVVHEPDFMLPDGAMAPPVFAEEYERGMKVKLDQLCNTLSGSGAQVEAHTARGIAHDAINAFVEKVGANLIVLGTHGRTGVAHMLLGSVAERIARTAKVPVITVRTP